MGRLWKWTLLTLAASTLMAGGWTAYQYQDIQRTWRVAAPVRSDALIVLGAGVWNGGPSPALRERLDVALQVWNDGLVPTIICTGGVGDDPRSEASVCAEYLQARGVPPEKVILEERSASTWENLTNVRPILQEQGLQKVLIATHGFHMKRALIQARDLGVDASGAPVRIRPINEPLLILREVAALTYYRLGGRDRVDLFRWSVGGG